MYLLEDGLGLWTALLIASTQPSEPLVALFPRAVSLLEGSSEHVRDIIRIIDLYIAMHPQVVDVCLPLRSRFVDYISPISLMIAIPSTAVTLPAYCLTYSVYLASMCLEVRVV